MKRASCKKKFASKVAKYLEKIGAVRTDNLSYRYELQSKVGKVYIHPCERHSSIFTIFMRFDDIQLVKESLPLLSFNQYSGKCNFHSETADIFDNFKRVIETIK